MGIVERKLREKEQRIQEILSAARLLLISKGYWNTTMHDIAEKSELSRRTLYIYFKSKEEITFRVIKEAYELLFSEIQTASRNCSGTGIEKLENVRDAYLNFYKNHFNQLIFTLYFDYKMNSKDLENDDVKKCFEIVHNIIDELILIIQKGKKDKTMQALPDERITALTAVTMIQSTMQKLAVRSNWVEEKFKLSGEEVIKEMFSILISFIRV